MLRSLRATVVIGTAALLLLSLSAQAALYTFTGPFANSGVINDSDPIGLTDAHTLSGLAPTTLDVILTVHLSGSYIDDLTGYIRLGNLTTSPSFNLDSYLTPDHNDFTVDLVSFQ